MAADERVSIAPVLSKVRALTASVAADTQSRHAGLRRSANVIDRKSTANQFEEFPSGEQGP
jgi:hypothetical protein